MSHHVTIIRNHYVRDLPSSHYREIVDTLFKRFVTVDEESFSRELYMNKEHLYIMKANGMYIGNHGYDHIWLNTLTLEMQEHEIALSLKFFSELGYSHSKWAFCYPYGAYNDSLISVLKRKGCVVGLTTEAKIADLDSDNSLTLPRIDTNDLAHL